MDQSPPAETPAVSNSGVANVEGHDGVCFTAGAKAAIVGAGTIHAYLASRRAAPTVVAGISLGALNAAAMQRVYRDLRDAEQASTLAPVREAARWRWFRAYLDVLSKRPFDVIWKAIPDLSDFFADMIPIRDPATPPALRDEETAVRRLLYLKVKLGRWLALLPITAQLVASTMVNFVRYRERYPFVQRWWSFGALASNLSWLLLVIAFRVCMSPQFIPGHTFRSAPSGPTNVSTITKRLKFGWLEFKTVRAAAVLVSGWLNLVAAIAAVVMFGVGAGAIILLADWWNLGEAWLKFRTPLIITGLVLLAGAVPARLREWILRWAITRFRPLFEFGANTYSIVNALLVLWMLYLAMDVAVLAVSIKSGGSSARQLSDVFPWWVMSATPFLPAVLIPETRRRLVERGLLGDLPRPLFGWGVLLGCWMNMLGLIGTLLGGWSFVAYAAVADLRPSGYEPVPPLVTAALVLPLIPAIPLLPFALSFRIWAPLRRLAAARRGWRQWAAWSVAGLLLGILLVLAVWGLHKELVYFERLLWSAGMRPKGEFFTFNWHVFQLSVLSLMLTWFMLAAYVTQPGLRRRSVDRMLDLLGLKGGLIPDLQLRLTLRRLFESERMARTGEAAATVDGGRGVPVGVFVATPLQSLHDPMEEPESGGSLPTLPRGPKKKQNADQFWAAPGTPLEHALRAALSSPPFFGPVHLEGASLSHWLSKELREAKSSRNQLQQGVDLVDGSVIRHNPLPALFGFLRTRQTLAESMASNNDRHHAAIHVVYGVPTERRLAVAGEAGIADTIVDVGLASLRLSRRRDTQLEVIQTNLISRLESCIPPDGESRTHAIFADEIAPQTDITFSNQFDPSRDEVLKGVAAGCRRTVERLYSDQLRQCLNPSTSGTVACHDLLIRMGRRNAGDSAPPGLPEVCGLCTGVLAVPPGPADAESSASIETYLSKPVTLLDQHPQLAGKRPRVVLVASGGVFRGAFHIGLLAALREAGLKPDLIVGASVGTLMGGALGAMYCRPNDPILEDLVDVFTNVDERVALTHTLKAAARELGLRGRLVSLSPGRIRSMVRAGARRDPGFATTGAPSALIDALSDLFLIPHRRTQAIASSFVAGDVTGAVKKLIRQLRTETIRRLDIERAVLGTSLLEQVAVDLLSDGSVEGRFNRQPFQREGIGFYATATNLDTQSAILLGGDGVHDGAPYDFIQAALASSAFPAVFAPRPESLVFPGTGRSDVLLADGGMFDNLPFLPAIEVLSMAQIGYRRGEGGGLTARDLLRRRIDQPDLLIVGALDPRTEVDDTHPLVYDSLVTVQERVTALKHNVKIRSVELAARRVDGQLRRLASASPAWLDQTTPHFVDRIVNAGVLSIFPKSRDHLNGTFSFCASLGLKPRRIQTSIADGCYQTMAGLVQQQAHAGGQAIADDPDLLAARSLAALRKAPNQAVSTFSRRDTMKARGSRWECPYFSKDGRSFRCPFTPSAEVPSKDARKGSQMLAVFRRCTTDPSHNAPGRE